MSEPKDQPPEAAEYADVWRINAIKTNPYADTQSFLAGFRFAEERAKELFKKLADDYVAERKAHSDECDMHSETNGLLAERLKTALAEVDALSENLAISNRAAYEADKWKALAEKLAEALERQQHPHIEQFCRERAREALKEFERAKG